MTWRENLALGLGFIGFMRFIGFIGFMGFIGLIGFIGFIGFTGFIGFIGFTGFIGLIGFTGFGFKGFLRFRVQGFGFSWQNFQVLYCRSPNHYQHNLDVHSRYSIPNTYRAI